MNDFSSVLDDPRCRFYGNVDVGVDVPLAALRGAYDAVVLAYGASGDRRIGVTGEGLRGVHSAREFVNWYNGHPDYREIDFGAVLESGSSAVVIGHGNVAIDVARVLLTNPDELGRSDICDHALRDLRESSVREVTVAGRRGPAQSAFTIKELRELTRLDGVHCAVSREDMDAGSNTASMEEVKASRPVKRKFELLQKVAGADPADSGADKTLAIRFFLSPVRLLPGEGDNAGAVAAVEFSVTQLQGEPGQQSAVDSGETLTIPADLVLTSVGYQAEGMEGAPFDFKRSVVPSVGGRVVQEMGEVVPGLYVSGWLKRGPTGIIGTNIPDAKETVNAILEDMAAAGPDAAQPATRGADGSPLLDLLDNDVRNHVVTTEGWRRIEQRENELGAALGKPREKLVDVDEAVRVALQGRTLYQ